MDTKPSNTVTGSGIAAPGRESFFLPQEGYGPLLADFPDPVLVTDRRHAVVFLNQAAARLFGDALHPGDPCPVCAGLPGVSPGPKGPDLQTCPQGGVSLNCLPLLLELSGDRSLSLNVTATPIRREGEEAAGCFLMLQEVQLDPLAYRAFQLQQATLSCIMEKFPAPFLMVNQDLIVTHMNEHMEKLTGYKGSEVAGKITCSALLKTRQCPPDDCVLKKVMRSKKPISGLPRTIQDRKGREIEVLVSACPIADHTGRVIGGFETLQDITPIVESRRKFELLTELTKEAIVVADYNQRVLYVNPKMAEIAELPREELIGKPLGEVLSPHHERSARELLRMMDQGLRNEVHFCSTLDPPRSSPHAERRLFDTSMVATRIGRSLCTCICLRDLADSIAIGRELQKTIIFLQNIIKCSVDGILVMDPKGKLLIFNEGAERILGYKAEEIMRDPKAMFQFYPRELAKEMKRRMLSDEYGPRDKLNTTQISFINKQGEEVPVNFSAAIIREGEREVCSVGIFSDRREQIKLERELEQTQYQLMQWEKMASLGRLAAGVAHQINNPLAGILIYADLLLRNLPADSPEGQNLQVIIEQTLRCQQIIARLLDFSRQSLGEKMLFDLNEIIQHCVELLGRQTIFHNIQIVCDLDSHLPQIIGDPVQLQEVVTNLMLNAADAIEGAGQITITSRAAPNGQGVVLTLSDTGCGIPPEMWDKVFEPFFTTKAPGKGTGLGLSIVYSIIQRHGGTIEVDSQPGGGTTFTIKLPLTPGEQSE